MRIEYTLALWFSRICFRQHRIYQHKINIHTLSRRVMLRKRVYTRTGYSFNVLTTSFLSSQSYAVKRINSDLPFRSRNWTRNLLNRMIYKITNDSAVPCAYSALFFLSGVENDVTLVDFQKSHVPRQFWINRWILYFLSAFYFDSRGTRRRVEPYHISRWCLPRRTCVSSRFLQENLSLFCFYFPTGTYVYMYNAGDVCQTNYTYGRRRLFNYSNTVKRFRLYVFQFETIAKSRFSYVICALFFFLESARCSTKRFTANASHTILMNSNCFRTE